MLCIFNLFFFKNEFLFQIVKMKENNGLYDSFISDYINQNELTVFERRTRIQWIPVLLVSKAHMRLFAYLIFYR